MYMYMYMYICISGMAAPLGEPGAGPRAADGARDRAVISTTKYYYCLSCIGYCY